MIPQDSDRDTASGKTAFRLWPSLVGIAIAYIIAPAFYSPLGARSHLSIEGTGIAVLAFGVCSFGLIGNVHRPFWAKLVVLTAFAFTAVYAGWNVIAFIRYGGGE